jgi:hypothetical protein
MKAVHAYGLQCSPPFAMHQSYFLFLSLAGAQPRQVTGDAGPAWHERYAQHDYVVPTSTCVFCKHLYDCTPLFVCWNSNYVIYRDLIVSLHSICLLRPTLGSH